jgi:hypothetical protein
MLEDDRGDFGGGIDNADGLDNVNDLAEGCDVAAHEAVVDRSEVSDAQALVEREDPREGSELGEDPY